MTAARSGPCTPLARQVAAMIREPAVARAHWGVMVEGMDGTPIYGVNDAQFFQPASNTKLFTTAAAMALLGGGRRWTTAVEGPSGSHGQAVIEGDLRLLGAGDANLSERPIPYVSSVERKRREAEAKGRGEAPAIPRPLIVLEEMADAIQRAGVTRVTGGVVGDDTMWPWEPYAPDWSIDDAVWGYGAPVSALSVGDNQMELTVTAGASAGAPASVTLIPEVPAYYTVDATGLRTGAPKSGSHVQVERAIGSRVLRVYGTIAVDAEPDLEEVAIEDPAEFAAAALKKLLAARGIIVEGKSRAEHRLPAEARGSLEVMRQELLMQPAAPGSESVSGMVTGAQVCMDACPLRVEHRSPALREDVTVTMKVSQNLHAEMLLRHLGKQYGADGSVAEGTRVVRQFLLNAGLDGDDFVFYDGSGLSGHDLVTPRATVQLLTWAARQPWFAAWKASLPVGGEDGSLLGRFGKGPLKDHVFAKTGTLGEARALSGYVDCASGRTLAFSVMVTDHAPGGHADQEVMDRIVTAIAAAN